MEREQLLAQASRDRVELERLNKRELAVLLAEAAWIAPRYDGYQLEQASTALPVGNCIPQIQFG
jgi:hypothetical protein